ncbi:MAG TPA: hypothetical protein DIC35_04565 [Candidatus Moranbacteria bacterium]|nr:hypothetical protein [Candidatus Moranbacteria bacterium]
MLLLVALLLSGCAVPGSNALKIGPDNIVPVVRPEQSVGVWDTPALKAGKVTVTDVPLTDRQIGSELRPGRIMLPGFVANSQGEVFFAQAILAGNYPKGEFMAYLIVETDDLSKLAKANFFPLTSRANACWNKDGRKPPTPIDQEKLKDPSFMAALARENGIPLGKRGTYAGVVERIKSWHHGEANGVEIYSQLSEDDVKELAKINPGYSFLEQLVLRNQAVVSINPIEMVAKASITVFNATNGKTQGWDNDSELPSNDEMGRIIDFIGRFRLEMMKKMVVQQEGGRR